MPKNNGQKRIDQIRDELERISNKYGGKFSTQNVVDESRSKNAVLHSCFCWDDSEAAEAFRRDQAGLLIRKVEFVIQRPAGNGKKVAFTVKRYHSLKKDRTLGRDQPEEGSQSYQPIDTIISSASKRAQLVQEAYEELQLFMRKYYMLDELQPVINTIKRLAQAPIEVTTPTKAVTPLRSKQALPAKGKRRSA